MAAGTFIFKGVDAVGVPQKGEIVGASKQEVMDQLKAQGITAMDIEQKKTGLNAELTLPGMNRVKAADLTVMTRQLATMVSSGMTLLRAFYVLEDQVENKKLKETLSGVREDIEAGLQFSDALARHPKVFGPLYVAMVHAGEAGGVLEDALNRVADQLEKDDSLRRQVKAAMMYPAVVLSFAMLVLVGLIAFIVPVFVGIFDEFGGELPLITKLTVAMSDMVTQRWYILIAGAVGLVVGFKKWRTSSGQDRRDRPEDRARPLVAHLRRALRRRRADPPGHRGHRPHGRQHRDRAGDGERHRFREVRRLAHRAAARGADLPADGRPDDRRRRGDGRPGHDAQQGRRLLRGRGGRGHQGPHVHPRARHDRLRGRHRRLHRGRHVHADVQGLRGDSVERSLLQTCLQVRQLANGP
jgi:hypothetical protein